MKTPAINFYNMKRIKVKLLIPAYTINILACVIYCYMVSEWHKLAAAIITCTFIYAAIAVLVASRKPKPCKYCGCITTQSEELCYKNPNHDNLFV